MCAIMFENALLPSISACSCCNTEHQKAKVVPYELCVSVVDNMAEDKRFFVRNIFQRRSNNFMYRNVERDNIDIWEV
jgi:hypothetical protein